MELPALNFPACKLRVCERGGKAHVWDPLRGVWLRLTPEEWVRRHTIEWLTGAMGAVAQRVVQEYPVCLSGMAQRADIVVTGRDGRPLLLCECKAAGVAIDTPVLAQAVRYNSVVGARYLMLTNGVKHYFYEVDPDKNYVPLDTLPDIFHE